MLYVALLWWSCVKNDHSGIREFQNRFEVIKRNRENQWLSVYTRFCSAYALFILSTFFISPIAPLFVRNLESSFGPHCIWVGMVTTSQWWRWGIWFSFCSSLLKFPSYTITSGSFSNEASSAVNSSWMELHELHVRVVDASTRSQGSSWIWSIDLITSSLSSFSSSNSPTISSAGVSRSAGEVGSAISTSGQHGVLCAETMNRSVLQIECDHPDTNTLNWDVKRSSVFFFFYK